MKASRKSVPLQDTKLPAECELRNAQRNFHHRDTEDTEKKKDRVAIRYTAFHITGENRCLPRLVIRSSDIHAAGCFTLEDIRKGTRVLEYTGERITKTEGDDRYDGRPFTYLFGIGDGEVVIDGHGMAMFVNHSCDPNCETNEEDGRVYIESIRDIAAGEELTYDYCLYDGQGDEPCSCGSKNCRGSMYSPEELRRKRRSEARKKKRAELAAKRNGARSHSFENRE